MVTSIPTFASLPEFISSHDLVKLGLFSSADKAYVARVRGNGPAFLKIGRRVMYPKASVMQFINDHLMHSSPRNTNAVQSA